MFLFSQKPQLPTKGSSKKKAEAAAAAQAAAAAAAAAAASATVEVREILADGSAVLLCKAIDGRKESVLALQVRSLLLSLVSSFPSCPTKPSAEL